MNSLIDEVEARRVAEQHILSLGDKLGERLAISHNVRRVERGWAFPYNTGDVVAGETELGLAGNLPFLVTDDGDVEDPAPEL